jgi:hypothetical protein
MKGKVFRALVAVSVLFSSAAATWGQPPTQSASAEQFKIKLDKLVSDIIREKKKADFNKTRVDELLGGGNIDLFAFALIARSNKEFVTTVEDARVDKQVGGGDTNAGSTTLVAKGSVPAVFGFAVENGALKSEQNGTTITFRGNPVGIIKLLGKEGFLESYSDTDAGTNFLRRLSFALSFDASRGNQPGTFTGDLNQLSNWSLRLDVLNKRDPRHPSYRAKWIELITEQGQLLTQDSAKLSRFFREDSNLAAWLGAAREAVFSASQDKVESEVKNQLFVELAKVPLTEDIQRLVDSYRDHANAFLLNRDNILQATANGAILTFEYANTRNINEPDLSNFKLIAEGAAFSGKADFTANASLTILNKIPVSMNLKRLRDFQMSGQLDLPLGPVQSIGSVVLSLSGKFQRLMDDITMSNGMVAMNTKGTIGVGQIKLTIPVKGAGVKIPLSVTFANRSELIKEKTFVRGNFGVTFDLDSIFSKLKP